MKKATKEELQALAELPDDQINLDDAPEILDWSGAERGKFYRPVKKQISLRVDADVLAWFKAQGGKYQTRMNQALRDVMENGSL